MPTKPYGLVYNSHPENCDVLLAWLRRFHDAVQSRTEEVVIWGPGTPMCEFLSVEDMNEASLFATNLDRETYDREIHSTLSHIHVGTGTDVTFCALVETIAETTLLDGQLTLGASKPNGTPPKLMIVSRLSHMDWSAKLVLKEGISDIYRWLLA